MSCWDQRVPSHKLMERQLHDLYRHDVHLREYVKSSKPRTAEEAKLIASASASASASARRSVQAKVAQALAVADVQRPIYNPKDCPQPYQYNHINDMLLTKHMVDQQLFRNGVFTGQFWNQSTRQDREK